MSLTSSGRICNFIFTIILVGSMSANTSRTLPISIVRSACSFTLLNTISWPKYELKTYQITFQILNFRYPKQCTKWTNCLYQDKLIWSNKVMYMENHCLHECLEVLANQTILILHHVSCANGRNAQTIYVCRFKSDNKHVLLCFVPRQMQIVPDVLHNPKQNCMEYFHRCVLCQIKTCNVYPI